MTEAKLPEELIREIIRLCIPPFCPKAFLRFPVTHNRQQYSSERAEIASVLLVSRRWLRIGTPMLYEGVVLSTSRQTSSIARLVATDPAVGRMIQYLRLESGSMTRELVKLAKHAPNVHTVYVEGDLLSDDSYDGLLRAVRYLRPTRLYIHVRPAIPWSRYGHHSTTRNDENLAVLSAIVSTWASVTEIHFSDGEALDHIWQHCLQKLPSLREVHVPTPVETFSSSMATKMVLYATSPAFKRIVFHGTEKRDYVARCFGEAKGDDAENVNTLAWEDESD